jgi:hypothetical protein
LGAWELKASFLSAQSPAGMKKKKRQRRSLHLKSLKAFYGELLLLLFILHLPALDGL